MMATGEKLAEAREILLSLTTDIVVAYVGNNPCPRLELTALIKDVYTALDQTALAEHPVLAKKVTEKQKPAIHPKHSVTDEYIVCLEDGRRFKSLKRHLMAHYQLTPEQYREKWDLAADYPMVAPSYAKERAHLAKRMGLGHKKSKKPSAKSS